jgi:PAS domain S-box-containing protein
MYMPMDNIAETKKRNWVGPLALACIPVILIFLGYLLSTQFGHAEAVRRQADEAYRARILTQRILSLHQDVETGQRGYLLTGNPGFLEPYQAGRAGMPSALAALQRTFASRPAHYAADLQRLVAASEAKLQFTEMTIERMRSGRASEASALIATGRGKKLMDMVRREIEDIQAEEQRRLSESLNAAREAGKAAKRMTFGLLAALGLLLFGAAWAQNKSERGRKKALEEAKNIAHRLETIFNSAKDGIVLFNRSGTIENVNPALCRMSGYDAAELARRDVAILFEIAPEQDEVESFLRRMERGVGNEDTSVREFSARRKDGSRFPADVTLSTVALEGGMRFAAFIRDATERQEVARMKTEFISTVSHELRTPLTSIAGSLGLLIGGVGGALPERATQLLNIALSNSKRLVRLINDILDIEKIESGAIDLHPEPLPLAELLRLVVDENSGFAREYDVRLELAADLPGIAIFGDRDRIIQVLTNLISNAVKFSPTGGQVAIGAKLLGRRVRISVADRGPGIPEEFRSRIFGKFAQADSTDTRQKGGTGLGLSIVKEIVTRSGGAVSFDSVPGEGTVFHVDLPVQEARFEHAAAPDGAPSVLHVEDDPDVLGIVRTAFGSRAAMHCATSLAEARAVLRETEFDLNILDVALPDGSGLDLLSDDRLAAERSHIIVFSAQDLDRPLPPGVDAVLTKSRASLDNLIAESCRLVPRLDAQVSVRAP